MTNESSAASWHLTRQEWRAYTAGTLPLDRESALEAHIICCPVCRARAREIAGDPQPIWQAVHARIDHPRSALPLRILTRLGVSDSDLVVIASVDDLRLPWAIAVGGAIACAFVTALSGVGDLPVFLALAPLVPVMAVTAAFDATDPLRELSNATAYPRLRLTLLRTLATLAVALPAVLLLGSMVPGVADSMWLWPIPGLLLTATTLLLLSWLSARTAAAISALSWLAMVSSMSWFQVADLLGHILVQGLFALLTVLFVIAFTALADRPQTIGAPS